MISNDKVAVPRARLLTKKNIARIVLGFSIGVILLVLVIRRLDVSEFGNVISRVSVGWLIAAVAIKVCTISFKAVRWGVVLRHALGRRPKRYIRATYLGFFGNVILPVKLGELLRLEVARRHNDAGFPQVLATMAFDRTFDALLLLIFIGLAMLWYPLPPWAETAVLPLAATAVGLALTLIFLAAYRIKIPEIGFLGSPGRWFIAKGNVLVGRFGEGLGVTKVPSALAACIGLTLLAWGCEMTGMYVAFQSLDLQLPYSAAFVLTSIVALGVAVPSAPAGIGTHQALYVVLLATYGVTTEEATSLSVLIVTSMIAILSIIGFWLLRSEGLSLRKLGRLGTDQEVAGTRT